MFRVRLPQTAESSLTVNIRTHPLLSRRNWITRSGYFYQTFVFIWHLRDITFFNSSPYEEYTSSLHRPDDNDQPQVWVGDTERSRRRQRSGPEMSSCQHPQIVCSFRSGSRQAGRVTLIWTLTQLSSLEWSKWKRWIRFWSFSKTKMSRRKRRRLEDSFSQMEASPSTWFPSSCSLFSGLSVSALTLSDLTSM